jgi:threonine/homoserine/homoserine lactone efflux protein
MVNLYYLLWVDAIINAKEYKEEEPGWKFSVFWILTLMNAMNGMTLLLWLDYFGTCSYNDYILYTSDSFFLGMVIVFINWVIPFSIINFALIFYKDRYKRLIKKYPNKYGKFALGYSLSSIFLLVFTIVLTKIL